MYIPWPIYMSHDIYICMYVCIYVYVYIFFRPSYSIEREFDKITSNETGPTGPNSQNAKSRSVCRIKQAQKLYFRVIYF